MNISDFLKDYTTETEFSFCIATNIIEKIKYDDFFIRIKSPSDIKNYPFASYSSMYRTWSKLSVFIECRNLFKRHLERQTNAIGSFERTEGTNIADILDFSDFEMTNDKNPFSPSVFIDFTRLSMDSSSSFKHYIKVHYGDISFNRIRLYLSGDITLFCDEIKYDGKTRHDLDNSRALGLYLLLKIGQRFSKSYINWDHTIVIPHILAEKY